MAETRIHYCDRTWDLTIGCRKRSEGCVNCWACRTVRRLEGKKLRGYCGQVTYDGQDWARTDAVTLLDWNLELPLHWKKPAFVFVNSKSDLFDERVPFEFIARAFDVMVGAWNHRFMVLTKEPGRMAEFIAWYMQTNKGTGRESAWPNPHVILMVSVEGPEHVDRIETLIRIPAAMRGVSVEPMISPLAKELMPFLWRDRSTDDGLDEYGHLLDWVVVGCEKLLGGRAGRWIKPDMGTWWEAAEDIVNDCISAVPVWVKQGPNEYDDRPGVWVTADKVLFPEGCQVQQKPNGLIL